MFEANALTRALVVTAQVTMTPFLCLVYAISPATMHRWLDLLGALWPQRR
jgi:hypothetical protein